jgi:hypothetical protein
MSNSSNLLGPRKIVLEHVILLYPEREKSYDMYCTAFANIGS